MRAGGNEKVDLQGPVKHCQEFACIVRETENPSHRMRWHDPSFKRITMNFVSRIEYMEEESEIITIMQAREVVSSLRGLAVEY